MQYSPARSSVPGESMTGIKSMAADQGWEEIEGGSFVTFKAIGDMAEGTYKGCGKSHLLDEKTGEPKDEFYFETADGVPFTITAPSDLKGKLRNVSIGQFVRMTYVESRKTGKPMPMKVFKVQVRNA